MKNKILIALLLAAALLPLAACGKKPGFVDPPAGQENEEVETYPRSYPEPWL